MKIYTISTDYSPITGLRYCYESECSGEDFYHKCLNKWFYEAYVNNREHIKIILDGGEDGYGPSFRDESFGNLVYDFTLDVINEMLEIVAEGDDIWKEEIENQTFLDWEKRRKEKTEPDKYEEHPAWWRLVDGKLECKVWVSKKEE